MNEVDKRIKIAEACGYKRFNIPYNNEQKVLALNQEQANSIKLGRDINTEFIPNYFSDLNACHEMESGIMSGQYGTISDYIKNLADECIAEYPEHAVDWSCLISSSASQRAEAFGKTLGLW